jgi:hypothetical protein
MSHRLSNRYNPVRWVRGIVVRRSVQLPAESDSVKRPAGVTIIAISTFVGAAILAIGAMGFFFIAFMAVSGGDGGDPVSASIAGMGVAGGFSLLVLSGVALCIAIGVLRLREWARLVSIAAIGIGLACTIVSVFAFAGHPIIPLFPMTLVYALLIGSASWMIYYLAQPTVKQAFRGFARPDLISSSVQPASVQPN